MSVTTIGCPKCKKPVYVTGGGVGYCLHCQRSISKKPPVKAAAASKVAVAAPLDAIEQEVENTIGFMREDGLTDAEIDRDAIRESVMKMIADGDEL